MNFVRYEELSQNCLPAGWRSGIINRSNIPLHPDSFSRTRVWQESVKSHLAVKPADKDESFYDSWHEIRSTKKQALCWRSASLAVQLWCRWHYVRFVRWIWTADFTVVQAFLVILQLGQMHVFDRLLENKSFFFFLSFFFPLKSKVAQLLQWT